MSRSSAVLLIAILAAAFSSCSQDPLRSPAPEKQPPCLDKESCEDPPPFDQTEGFPTEQG